MAIEWTEDLAVGMPEIDAQHQELFRKIDQLLGACIQCRGKEVVGETIQFLGDYVIEHFGNEERYMKQFNYPESADHIKQHRQFIESFEELKKKFESDGPGTHIVIMTNRAVVGWLNSHIRKVDKLLGEFLKTKI